MKADETQSYIYPAADACQRSKSERVDGTVQGTGRCFYGLTDLQVSLQASVVPRRSVLSDIC